MELDIKIKDVCWKHAEAICNSRLIELGYTTFFPFNGGTEIDLIAFKNGECIKIQIKSVSPKNNESIQIDTCISSINYKTSKSRPYENIDWFLIYDGNNIYKIINKDISSKSITLRYKNSKNNQSIGVKMASDYIF